MNDNVMPALSTLNENAKKRLIVTREHEKDARIFTSGDKSEGSIGRGQQVLRWAFLRRFCRGALGDMMSLCISVNKLLSAALVSSRPRPQWLG